MSRRIIVLDGSEVVVGWDSPTQTYFADTGQYSTMLDGGRFDILAVKELELAAGIKIPEETRRLLEEDKATSPEPTPFQKSMSILLGIR